MKFSNELLVDIIVKKSVPECVMCKKIPPFPGEVVKFIDKLRGKYADGGMVILGICSEAGREFDASGFSSGWYINNIMGSIIDKLPDDVTMGIKEVKLEDKRYVVLELDFKNKKTCIEEV